MLHFRAELILLILSQDLGPLFIFIMSSSGSDRGGILDIILVKG